MYQFYLYVVLLMQMMLSTQLTSSQTLEELKLTQDMMNEDIIAIKKVWVDVTSKLNKLAKKLDDIDTSGVIESFKDEKMKTRKLEELVTNSSEKINDIVTSLNVYDSEVFNQSAQILDLDKELFKFNKDFEKTRKVITTLQKSSENIEESLDILNQTFHRQQVEGTQYLSKPSFVSDWILMRAQDPALSEKTIPHDLNSLPFKVDVQIRPTTGPNAGWIFTGDSAIQSDDDKGRIYGGILYFYDENNVYLLAPLKNNDKDAGVVINTGESGQRRIGNNHQTSIEAYVRIKVWASTDFPKPDMTSEWLPLNIRNESLTYYDVKHGLKEYPGFVNVQIRCKTSKGQYIISEGIGASMMHISDYSGAGGVVHAFNDNSVRIWTGYVSNTTGKYFYRLFGLRDGWTGSMLDPLDVIKGEVRVLTWTHDKVIGSNTEYKKHENNIAFSEWTTFKDLSPDVDLFSVHVQANDGQNQGFRFPAYGNSQTQASPYGGVVFAYNSFGEVRLWRPNPSEGGYLINIHEPYGNGVNVQSSNNAHYVSTILRCRK